MPSLIDPIQLPTYSGRIIVEDDRSWLEEVFEASEQEFSTDVAIIPTPDPTTPQFQISAVWSIGEERIIWTMNNYTRGLDGRGMVVGGALAIHPNHRGQGHHQRYINEIFAFVKETDLLHDDFSLYTETVTPAAASSGIVPGVTAQATQRGSILRSGLLQDIYDSI